MHKKWEKWAKLKYFPHLKGLWNKQNKKKEKKKRKRKSWSRRDGIEINKNRCDYVKHWCTRLKENKNKTDDPGGIEQKIVANVIIIISSKLKMNSIALHMKKLIK